VPAYLIWGKEDRDVPASLSGEFKKLMPKAELLVVEDAAHVPFLERPEVVLPVLLRFIEGAGI